MTTKKKPKASDVLKWRGITFKRPKDAVNGVSGVLVWTTDVLALSSRSAHSFSIDITRSTATNETLSGCSFEVAMYSPTGSAVADGEGGTEQEAIDALLIKLQYVEQAVRYVLTADAREGHVVRSRSIGFTPPTGPARVKVATFRRVPPPSASTIARARPPHGPVNEAVKAVMKKRRAKKQPK